MKKLFLLTISILMFNFIFAQNEEFELGKIDIKELQNNVCPIDSNAGAYIIAEYGNTYSEKESMDNYSLVFNKKIRIKIIKNSEVNQGTFRFQLISSYSGFEKLEYISGYTYNLENGTIVKSKLKNESQFEELLNANRKEIKISMPNVKEGSVIDLEYTIRSPYLWNVRNWQFQHDIPVLLSHYNFKASSYCTYKGMLHGLIKVETPENENNSKKNGKSSSGTHDQKTYIATNVPAYKEEPFMLSPKNYISYVEYELESVSFPGRSTKNYSKDWVTIRKDLLDNKDFGDLLNDASFLKDTLERINFGIYDPKEKAKTIYNYVRTNFKWNGREGIYAHKKLKTIVKDKTGSIAEINLLLTAMLKQVGFKSYPAILSTRNNGVILMSYPLIDKFNYVISTLVVANDTILLDATSRNCPFGKVPFRCLNFQAEMLGEKEAVTIDINPNTENSEFKIVDLKMNPATLALSGKIQSKSKGYKALSKRNDFFDTSNKDEYEKKILNKYPGLTIGSYEFKDFDSVEKPAISIFDDVEITGKVESNGDILTINPLLYDLSKKNPFKDEDRKYPVDYGYPETISYIFNFEIPKGYMVDELPKSAKILLPDNGGSYEYNIEEANGKIQLLSKFILSKTFFVGDAFKELREFYNQIITKENQLIVLKKGNTANLINK